MAIATQKKAFKEQKSEKVAFFSLVVSLSVIFSALEELYFIRIPVPGVKYGLGNIPLLLGVSILSPLEIFSVVFLKILIHSFLFYGFNPVNIWLSVAGGVASATILVVLKMSSLIDAFEGKPFKLSLAGAGALMGAFHIIFQILAAYFVLRTTAVFLYLPLSGLLSVILGFSGGVLSNYIACKLKN